jgi:UDP-N-acetylglucosamine 2-epimerase (non-hydrolysing)/GDP/UDP-N,N'-diacetylbacillosamine 2-epimerase (hydrolysing)
MRRSSNLKRRKICVVTTSRADFGLLSGLIRAIQDDPALELQLIASGMHLSKAFARTWRDIQAEGFRITRRIPMRMEGGSAAANLKSIGLGLNGFAKAFSELRPDILVLLGDRFELFSPAIAALMLGIPIAHIHGGELSEGALDESIRHALTKMASLHFAATEVYRRRIIQMGEAPGRVWNFGAPGLDKLYDPPGPGSGLMTRAELEQDLGLSFRDPVAIVTFHPVTRDAEDPAAQVRRLVAAIARSGIQAIFTAANADATGANINNLLEAACHANPGRFKWAPHLGHRRYLSCLRHAAVMIGNSSSGLTEAPSFRLPVVNIGDRQQGRTRARNIIDVPGNEAAILKAIRRALSARFRQSLRGMRNPYDRYRDGRSSERIKNVLRDVPLSNELLKKRFHDLNYGIFTSDLLKMP